MVRLNLNGVLVVDKPRGFSSHALVAQARRLFQTRAVGHAGTLDPMATGVLLLLFGEAKKLSSFLTSESKRYLATVRFGRATDSFDADGSTTLESPLPSGFLTVDRLAQALAAERARTEQVPPAVSALKVGGERAYALTRRGLPPSLPARPVHVDALELASFDSDSATLEMRVSKGYYVRALARDLGEHLGAPAHLAALRRTASGAFTLEEAVLLTPGVDAALISTAEAARRCLPSAVLSPDGERRARLGQGLTTADFAALSPALNASFEAGPSQAIAWLSQGGELVALGHTVGAGEFRVARGFRPLPQLPDRDSADS